MSGDKASRIASLDARMSARATMAGRLARATGGTGARTSGREGGRSGRGDSSRGTLASGGRGRTTPGRGSRERRVGAVEEDGETPGDPSTSYYAPLDGKRRREFASAAAAAVKSKRIRKKADAAMSDDDVLADLIKDSAMQCSCLSSRLMSLRVLRRFWAAADTRQRPPARRRCSRRRRVAAPAAATPARSRRDPYR